MSNLQEEINQKHRTFQRLSSKLSQKIKIINAQCSELRTLKVSNQSLQEGLYRYKAALESKERELEKMSSALKIYVQSFQQVHDEKLKQTKDLENKQHELDYALKELSEVRSDLLQKESYLKKNKKSLKELKRDKEMMRALVKLRYRRN